MPKAIVIPEELKKLPKRIIVKFNDSLDLPYTSEEEINQFLESKKILSMNELQHRYPGIKIQRLFTSIKPGDIKRLVKQARITRPEYKPPNFLTYCTMICSHQTKLKPLLKELKANKHIQYAYISSPPVPSPLCTMNGSNPMNASQGYLDPAPVGIDARYAWSVGGGCGESNVRFIDIEYDWKRDHEDLRGARVGFLAGDLNNGIDKEHGTAVLGVILMQDNGLGGIGIVPKVKADVISRIDNGIDNIQNAIMAATDNLSQGDVLLLEIQINKFDNEDRLLPAEVESASFEVIELATLNGIVVVEAAANGNNVRKGYDIDKYKDEDGEKIFKRSVRDSGAIIVAGARSDSPHRKISVSNYGNRVDCYAWGENVSTTGRPEPDLPPGLYTDRFGGSSSASAIIAGAAIAIQSVLAAVGRQKLGPVQMRNILSNPANGTSSPNRIGSMPDLKKIIDQLIAPL